MLTFPAASLSQKIFDIAIRYEVTYIVDETYVLLLEDDLSNRTFQRSFAKFRDLWISQYLSGSGDCDDYADLGTFYVKGVHRRLKKVPTNLAVAFGDFYFKRRDGVYHAINCFFTLTSPESIGLRFFEPQTGDIITLTQEEIQSCTYIYM